jgi:RsiW-degrading membrane proteinase PrsW (M82 family)
MEYLTAPEGPPVPAAVKQQRQPRRWILLTGAILVIGGAAVAMLVTLGFNLGPRGLAVGLAAAVLPVPVLVACFLWLDRYEPEPVTYLLFAFAWGAAPATYAAYHVNTFAASTLELPESLVGVLVAPFIEELMKALGPLLILWTRRRAISGFTDGIGKHPLPRRTRLQRRL